MAVVQHQIRVLEDRYAHDQDVQFRINARRNALLGLWAADLMNKAEADAYAKELTEMSVVNPTGVFAKVSRDFEAAGIDGRDDEIHDRMRDLLQSAAVELRQRG